MTEKEKAKFAALKSYEMSAELYKIAQKKNITLEEFDQLLDIFLFHNRYRDQQYTGDCW
jgi:hypothetical protein